MILKSYAKLNLSLEVLGKRPDSYHNLNTIFERIDLCDSIILKKLSSQCIQIKTNRKDLPQNRENLAYRAAELLQKEFKIKQGVSIEIIKRIPVGAGLGGGSSNAAAVFMGLNKLWRLHLSLKKLAEYAGKVGSDVPFFIYNYPFARGESRGEVIKPLPSLRRVKFWHILVVPPVKVSTPYIYRQWDEFNLPKSPAGRETGFCKSKGLMKLTRRGFNVKILILGLKKREFPLISGNLHNSLEGVTSALFPVVRLVKKRLLNLGIKPVLMSGSGPAVFGIVSSRKEALSVFRRLKKENRFWETFVVRTV